MLRLICYITIFSTFLKCGVRWSRTPQMSALCGVRDRTQKTSVRVFTTKFKFFPTLVGSVEAKDKDIEENAVVYYSISENINENEQESPFAIEELLGEIKTTQELDFEKQQVHFTKKKQKKNVEYFLHFSPNYAIFSKKILVTLATLVILVTLVTIVTIVTIVTLVTVMLSFLSLLSL